jgi:PAS domain S-box-containing protein
MSTPTACRLLGYEKEELVGQTIFDIIPHEDASRLVVIRNKLLTAGAVDRGEWTLQRKDGTLVPVDVSANILPDGRWQAFVRDISERKRTEDERQVFVSLIAKFVRLHWHRRSKRHTHLRQPGRPSNWSGCRRTTRSDRRRSPITIRPSNDNSRST